MAEANADAQQPVAKLSAEALDELEALESTEPGALEFSMATGRGKLSSCIHPQLQQPIVVRSGQRSTTLEHLQPVTIFFEIPPTYPTEAPPWFEVRCCWLTKDQCRALHDELGARWNQDDVLYAWLLFLRDEAWDFLQLTPEIELPDNQALMKMLQSFDEVECLRRFEQDDYQCSVCLGEKPGVKCHRLSVCKHVFCKECLRGYFQLKIQESAVKDMGCPVSDCRQQPSPHDVRAVVSKPYFDLYEKRLLEQTLATMADIVICPRCQNEVLVDDHQVNLASCLNCTYSFCVLCKQTWHGTEFCKVTDLDSVLKEYHQADEHGRKLLEQRYGTNRLVHAVNESASQAYLSENAQPCPHCKAKIEKFDGCNKMVCFSCNTKFCWLCRQILSALPNPYRHFQMGPNRGQCGGRLFEGMVRDDDGDGGFFFMFEEPWV